MVQPHHQQIIRKPGAAAIADPRKKTCSLREFCRIYLTWCCIAVPFHSCSRLLPSSSPKSDRTSRDPSGRSTAALSDHPHQEIEEETEEEKRMKGVYNSGDSLRGNSPASTSDRYFKHKSVDNFFPQYVSPGLSRNGSRKGSACPSPSLLYRSKSRGSIDSHHAYLRNASSRKGTATPIMFSNSTGLIKPAPLHKSLDCTLEELSFGCTKKIKVTRDVLTNTGQIIQEEEMLTINVKPGWKKGTKVTFEGMGNERPGSLPADITFIIAEKKHSLFRREGDNLELTIEIPLIKALTASEISIPLLGGNNFSLMFDDIIIYPGYHKLIQGQGMPNTKDHGKRGDLRVNFLVEFPSELTEDQRLDLVSILEDSG
ncbi:uncharacterized protein [Euphorbia lathyris]|uniref:uncharacterized protein n=1 Tax=Euphorbia lathyris TaxID=212925 RepID=UPI0033136D12